MSAFLKDKKFVEGRQDLAAYCPYTYPGLLYTYWEILTKKLCGSSQSEEWSMVFTREKSDTSNQNRGRCFFTCEKNHTSNQKPQRCVSFAPKFPHFLAALWAPLRTHSKRKVFLKEVFLVKKVKNILEMEWNSFVCFTVDKENCGELAKQQRKGKNRTRRKVMLCFLTELLCLPFISLSL